MEELYVLMFGTYNHGDEKPVVEETHRAFRSKNDMIEYAINYARDNIVELSRYGYVRIPDECEFIIGNKIRYARSYTGIVQYFRYDVCKF